MERLALKRILKELNITLLLINFFKPLIVYIFCKLFFNKHIFILIDVYNTHLAGWQSGYAAACKAVNAGSIPASASIIS